ncbi:MAG: TIGR04282 family arsenosugar biosynthesis glycosyltransferase [Desulfomonilaceae bacterium]
MTELVIQMMSSRIIVFTKYPNPGATKTRLIQLLGAQGSATLHARLTEEVVTVVRLFSETCNVPMEIRYYGGSPALMSQWLGDDLAYRTQEGIDIGMKMHVAFQEAFEEGCTRVVLLGTDIFGMSVAILKASLDLLNDHDLVLGPANDGGYYLVGLREPRPEIFENISWGSGNVLTETLQSARAIGLNIQFVQALDDVDRPEDIAKLNLDQWLTRP